MKLSDLPFILVGTGFPLLGFCRFARFTEIIVFSVFSWVLLIFLLSDLRYWYVPRNLAIFSASFGVAAGLVIELPSFYDRAVGALGGFIFLWCVIITATWTLRRIGVIGASEFAMGSGDPLLLAVIGGFVGYLGLPGILFCASAQGIVAYFLLRLFKGRGFRPPLGHAHPQAMPFGAFMCLAALELSIWPDLVRDLVAFPYRMM